MNMFSRIIREINSSNIEQLRSNESNSVHSRIRERSVNSS